MGKGAWGFAAILGCLAALSVACGNAQDDREVSTGASGASLGAASTPDNADAIELERFQEGALTLAGGPDQVLVVDGLGESDSEPGLTLRLADRETLVQAQEVAAETAGALAWPEAAWSGGRFLIVGQVCPPESRSPGGVTGFEICGSLEHRVVVFEPASGSVDVVASLQALADDHGLSIAATSDDEALLAWYPSGGMFVVDASGEVLPVAEPPGGVNGPVNRDAAVRFCGYDGGFVALAASELEGQPNSPKHDLSEFFLAFRLSGGAWEPITIPRAGVSYSWASVVGCANGSFVLVGDGDPERGLDTLAVGRGGSLSWSATALAGVPAGAQVHDPGILDGRLAVLSWWPDGSTLLSVLVEGGFVPVVPSGVQVPFPGRAADLVVRDDLTVMTLGRSAGGEATLEPVEVRVGE